MRRRKNNILNQTIVQDPGKDLFAYLFLMVMVFSFMLLMSTEERRNHLENQAAPENNSSNTASTVITKVKRGQLGRLIKNDKGIFLAFANELYDPVHDISRLKSDKRIISSSNEGEEGISLLYLVEDNDSRILLVEYLAAFQQLGSQGIRVASAERVR